MGEWPQNFSATHGSRLAHVIAGREEQGLATGKEARQHERLRQHRHHVRALITHDGGKGKWCWGLPKIYCGDASGGSREQRELPFHLGAVVTVGPQCSTALLMVILRAPPCSSGVKAISTACPCALDCSPFWLMEYRRTVLGLVGTGVLLAMWTPSGCLR